MKKVVVVLFFVILFCRVSVLQAQVIEVGDLTYNVLSDTSVGVLSCSQSAKSVIIPSTIKYKGTSYNVTSIDEGAFADCSYLKSVSISSNVNNIGANAFSDCSSLKTVSIPNGVTNIGFNAFSDCSSLKTVSIPNSVTNIGFNAFSDCSSLSKVEIPNSVVSIEAWAFSGCTSLSSISIPNSVTSIGYGAFSSCTSLTSINVSSDNKNYSSVDGVLYNYAKDTLIQCPGAKVSVTIQNDVTVIGDYSFTDCKFLTSVTIPNSIISIGRNAFSGCSSLTSTVSLTETPPILGHDCFYGCNAKNVLYIPCGSMIVYQSSSWNDWFANRVQCIK